MVLKFSYYKYILPIFIIILIIFIYFNIKNGKILDSTIENFNCHNKLFLSNKKKLWLYWDGVMPDYIKLCIKTIYFHCENSFDIKLLNNENIIFYIPELKQLTFDLSILPIEQRVDFYRLMLLYKYGGLYMDTDIIVLKDLSEVTDKLYDNDFVGFGCTGEICKFGYNQPSNWVMASNPGTQLIKNCIENIINKISSNINSIKNINKNGDYHGLGKKIIWEEIEKLHRYGYTYYHYHSDYDGTRDSDGRWVTMNRMFSNKNIQYTNPEKLLFIVLYNSDAIDEYKKMKMEDILLSKTNISKYIKKSLNII